MNADCDHRFGQEPMPVRPAFALSLLIRVNLRCHFIARGAAHMHQVGARTPVRETPPPSSGEIRQIAVLARVIWSGRLRGYRIVGIDENRDLNRGAAGVHQNLVVDCGDL
jgi:hypothetical protein